MSSSRRKFHLKHPVMVDTGCSCRRPKLSSLFFSSSSPPTPMAKQIRSSHDKIPSILSPSASSLTTTINTSSSSFSPSNVTSSPTQAFSSPRHSSIVKTRRKKKNKGVVEESVAVEKESSDPYLDFRDSMVQMIVEKEIYNWDELRELLHLFLSLNSPCYHHVIVKAFAELLS